MTPTRQTNMRLDPELVERARVESKRQGLSLARWTSRAMERALTASGTRDHGASGAAEGASRGTSAPPPLPEGR
jgi:hypothetical protein